MPVRLNPRRSPSQHWGRLAALASAAWLGAGVFEFMSIGIVGSGKDSDYSWLALAGAVFGFWGVAALLTPPLVWATRCVSFERGARVRAIAAYLITLLLFVPLHASVRWLWMNATTWHYQGVTPLSVVRGILPIMSNYVGGGMLVYVGVVVSVRAWDYYHRFRDRERAAAALELEQTRLRASLSEARLGTLQMQLQPHFLFNALHAISTLILKGENRGANEMLVHLSRFLRMAVDRADTPIVPLRIELESLDAYLRIQRERFSDRLHVTMDINERVLSAEVPNLIFQPLVENSIQHGIASESGSGRISVRADLATERLVLEVEDDGLGLPSTEAQIEGVGLGNTRERLAQLYPGEHEFTLDRSPNGGALARIVIPFRLVDGAPSAPPD